MNEYDSNRILDLAKKINYISTNNLHEASCYILNTCHIREKASEKVFSELGRLKNIKSERAKKGNKTLIAVSGCVAQAEGEAILKRAPYVDIIFGPQTTHLLPELVYKANRNLGTQVDSSFPIESKFDHLPIPKVEGPTAFLSVQEGCDKFCTFCVVPYTRGEEYSRPAADIIKEAKVLSSKGVKEITLLGQNVNAWHAEWKDKKVWGLGRLIKELSKIKELEFIRYTTSHPLDMDLELIEAHRDVSKLMPYLHLPIQSGSDNILRLMNRKHTVKEYIKVIEKVRHYNPNIALSGDFIVGFPGETDKDHQATLDLIKEIKYSQAYSFKYSIRPGTPAAISLNQVDESYKKSRLEEVQNILRDQQLEFNKQSINSDLKILVLKNGKKSNQYLGRSQYNQSVYFNCNEKNIIGSTVNINVTQAFQNSLTGNIINI